MPSAHPSSVSSPPLDRDALRVLAHPLRSRLLARLRVHGPATATELAAALETNTGATSYHLRRLEEVGLVADLGTGVGRRRVWEAGAAQPPATVAGSDETGDPRGAPDEDDAAAAQWLARDYVAHFGERAQQWVGAAPNWPEAWREVCGLDDHLVLVTAEQLTALQAEMLEVLERYRRVGQGTPGAKRVSVYTCALPVDPPPRPPTGQIPASNPGR